MKLKSHITAVIFLMILCLSVAGCSSKEKGADPEEVSNKLSEHEFKRKLELINPGLEDPASVIELIKTTGAEFMDNLVNTGDHDSIYLLDSALSALNLGIYADRENDDSYLNLMLILFHQENSLRKQVNLLDQIRRREEGERFMAMLGDLQLIFMEPNTPDELAGINTSNIIENQVFKDLVAQVANIRMQIIDPVYP